MFVISYSSPQIYHVLPIEDKSSDRIGLERVEILVSDNILGEVLSYRLKHETLLKHYRIHDRQDDLTLSFCTEIDLDYNGYSLPSMPGTGSEDHVFLPSVPSVVLRDATGGLLPLARSLVMRIKHKSYNHESLQWSDARLIYT